MFVFVVVFAAKIRYKVEVLYSLSRLKFKLNFYVFLGFYFNVSVTVYAAHSRTLY